MLIPSAWLIIPIDFTVFQKTPKWERELLSQRCVYSDSFVSNATVRLYWWNNSCGIPNSWGYSRYKCLWGVCICVHLHTCKQCTLRCPRQRLSYVKVTSSFKQYSYIILTRLNAWFKNNWWICHIDKGIFLLSGWFVFVGKYMKLQV